MRDEYLSTIPEMKSDEVIKSSVKNLVPIPSESEVTSENESECDVPVNDESSPIFMTFSNHLFDCNDDFTSSDDESLSNEDEFYGELAQIDPIPSRIEEVDFDTVLLRICWDILFLEELISNDSLSFPETESFHFDHYDVSSSPRPPLKPPNVEVLFNFKPDTGVFIVKVVEDISEHHVFMPKFLPSQPTLCPNIDTLFPFSSENKDKVFKPGILSYLLVSHRDKTIFDFSKNQMMMYGGDILLLDVPYLNFYPP
nr:hypothetical protein [Tanacetum cinerariifolium]